MSERNITIGIPSLKKGQMVALTVCFFLVFFTSSDTSVFSTASVKMLEDVGGANFYPMLSSLKGVTVVVSCLLCGRLIEILGRRNIMLLGIGIQTVCSVITALAPNMLVMLAARTVYGIGWGFVCTAVMIVINELFGHKSGYGYLITLLGYGAGNAGMPILIGWLVDYTSWRVGFWFMAACMIVAFLLMFVGTPNYTMKKDEGAVDYKGIVPFSTSIIMIVAVLSFGGKFLPWKSPITIGMIVLALVLMMWFLRHETRIDQSVAIFPVSILRSKLVVGCAAAQFAMGINAFGIYAYVPYFMQLEMGATAIQAGSAISVVSVLTTATGAVLLILMVKLQRHAEFGLATVLAQVVAVTLVWIFLSPAVSLTLIFILVGFYGMSDAVESYAFTMTVQTGMTAEKVAVATAAIQFIRQLTGVVSAAVATPIMNYSSSMSAGIKNVMLFSVIVTVVGALVYALCVPSTQKIKEQLAAELAAE